MAAHPTTSLSPELDPGGIERTIAERMPALMLGAIGVLAILWWMAAQPPPGPGWGNPNGPQQPNPQQGQGQGYGYGPQPVPPPPPPPQPSSGCATCAAIDCADCVSGIDCGDCASAIDCADCISGLDCTCAVSGTRRLAGSSGLLLPLFVMIGWRRRLRR